MSRSLLTEIIDLLDPPSGIAITLDADMPTFSKQSEFGCSRFSQNLLSNAVKHHDKA